MSTRKLKLEREKLGLSLAEVGVLLGITKQSLSAIENSETDPSYKVLVKLEEIFTPHTHRYLLEQVDETNTQADYTASAACGLYEAKELNSATHDFDVSVEMIVDIAAELGNPET